MLTCPRCGGTSDDDAIVCSKCLQPFPTGTPHRPDRTPVANRPTHGLDHEEESCPQTDPP